jgi:hypothetical protein
VRDLASIDVDQERDLGRRVERDADRQQSVHRQSGREQGIEIGGEEAGILEDTEHQQIAADACCEHGQSQPGVQFLRDQQQPDEVVGRDRGEQQRHELPAAERIEGDRRQHQPDHWPQLPYRPVAKYPSRTAGRNRKMNG